MPGVPSRIYLEGAILGIAAGMSSKLLLLTIVYADDSMG